jgi:hypothetical protein
MLTVAPATMSTFAVIVFELSHVSVLTGFPLDDPPLDDVDPPLDEVDPPLLLVEPPLEPPELPELEEEPPLLEVLPPLLEPPAAGGPPPVGPWVSPLEQPMAIAAKTAAARIRRVFIGALVGGSTTLWAAALHMPGRTTSSHNVAKRLRS